MIRVLVCDDHALVRRGIRDTLSDAEGIEVVGEAADYGSLRSLLRERQADVLVLDIDLPGRSGLDALQSLQDEHSPLRVVVVSMHPEEQYALRALRGGAHGYVHKGGNPGEIVEAVRKVAGGRRYITAELAEMLADNVAAPQVEDPLETLSEREMQTLTMFGRGKRAADIARQFHLSPRTVAVYRARLLAKLNLSTTAELMVFAIRRDLV